jgi:hypothetical protein
MRSVGSSTRSREADLIFDNTCLSHFARAGRLSVPERLTGGHRGVAPAQVITELIEGVGEHPSHQSDPTTRAH